MAGAERRISRETFAVQHSALSLERRPLKQIKRKVKYSQFELPLLPHCDHKYCVEQKASGERIFHNPIGGCKSLLD